jgi:hypothetical protein
MAPLQRVGAWLSGPFPRAVAASSRVGGGRKLAELMAEAQREKR